MEKEWNCYQEKHRKSICYCFNQKDYQKAIPIFQDVAEKQSSTLGEKHVDTLKTRYQLATCYYEQNNRRKAIQILQEVVEKRMFTLGENHKDTIDTKYWLARCYYEEYHHRSDTDFKGRS